MRIIRMNLLALTLMVGMAPVALTASAETSAAGETGMFAHMVFFSLAEPSAANRERLIAACRTYLSGHDGTLHFSVGSRATEMQREVNVTDYDVALHVVFDSRAAHDRYQEHPRHLQFVAENATLWNRVRVFDSHVD